MIYDRKTGEATHEKIYKDRFMRFLYNTTLGGLCVLFLRLPIISKLYGLFQKRRHSIAKINNLIETHKIETGSIEHDYLSFNDFIIRKRLQTDFDNEKNHLIAPADSCLLAYTIERGEILTIKNKVYTLSHFLKDETLAEEYDGGVFLVFRLRVYDNHRFCFVDDGYILSHKRISGLLDSINGNATGKFTLSSNYREISVLQTQHFDKIVFAEVGAMLVGRIVQTHSNTDFCRGTEKGYFEFGGSSIVMVVKKGIVKIDDDIWNCSAKGIETKINYGERIGKRLD